MNYSGIDLHSNNSVGTVIDETDRLVAEMRLPNNLTKILAYFAPWQTELAVSWSSRRTTGTGSSTGCRLRV